MHNINHRLHFIALFANSWSIPFVVTSFHAPKYLSLLHAVAPERNNGCYCSCVSLLPSFVLFLLSFFPLSLLSFHYLVLSLLFFLSFRFLSLLSFYLSFLSGYLSLFLSLPSFFLSYLLLSFLSIFPFSLCFLSFFFFFLPFFRQQLNTVCIRMFKVCPVGYGACYCVWQ